MTGSRSASGSSCTVACWTKTDGRYRRRWWRSGRPTPPDATPTALTIMPPARPELLRHGPRDHGLGRTLSVPDDHAGPLPVSKPLQRVAAGARALFTAGAELPDAAGNADVLSRRSAAGIRSDLSGRARTRPRSCRRRVRHRRHRAGLVARFSVRSRTAWARSDALRYLNHEGVYSRRRPSASHSSSEPNSASMLRILDASPTATITRSSSGTYF